MKKLMTATIILLPLIILAILLVSGAILSIMTHIYVESIEFSENETIVLIMQDESAPPTYELGRDVTILPLRASNREVEFSSADEALVSVNEDGLVTAKFWGETVITVASRENTAARAQRKVLVTDTRVHALVMNADYKKEMYEGETQTLSVGVFPKEALDKGVLWASSDESILRVSPDGTVTSVGEGTATVTATAEDNDEVTATAEITCHKRLVDISIDRSLVVTSQKTQKFPSVTKLPVDAAATFTYASSDETVASVDDEGNITFAKEGHVTISVTATDFGGRSVTRTKEYTSTYGYYMPELFEQASYSVDFDDYKFFEHLPITMTKAPDGAYREITGVSFSPEGVIEFDEDELAFYFVGQMLVGRYAVEVTVDATVYDSETNALNAEYQDIITISVTRKATEIYASYNNVSPVETINTGRSELFFSDSADGAGVVKVTAIPANHTDKISYTLISGGNIATLTEADLEFTAAGTAVVRISASETVSKDVTIVYTPPKPGTKNITFEDNDVKETNVTLCMRSDGNKDEGVIIFSKPVGATVAYSLDAAGKDVVNLVQDGEGENYRIVPKKGGFATVTIKVEYASPVAAIRAFGEIAAGDSAEYTINVYVNKTVSSGDFIVKVGGKVVTDSFTTSLTEIDYTVTATDNGGALAGKEIYVTVGDGEPQKIDGLNKTGTLSFAKAVDVLTIKIETGFSDVTEGMVDVQDRDALVTLTRNVTTTRGKLNAPPKVTCGGVDLTEGTGDGTVITFDDLNEEKTIKIEGPFSPADFSLADHKPEIKGNDFVQATVGADGMVTLTALQMTEENVALTLTVGGYTYKILAKVHSHADMITVSLGGKELSAGIDYKTLLNSLAFEIELGRCDDKIFEDTEIRYSVNDGGDYATATKGDDGKYTISWKELSMLRFATADNRAMLTLKIQKVTLDDFGIVLSYSKADGKNTSLLTVDSVKGRPNVECVLPADMQNALKIVITVAGEYLGGFGSDDQFEELFPTATTIKSTAKTGIRYNASDNAIIAQLPSGELSETVTVSCGAAQIELELYRINLAAVSFGSDFDMSVDNNVHKGYQQVRVFAKHSRYNGQTTDYFEMPVTAYTDHEGGQTASAGILTWRLYGVNGEDKTLMTYQKGRSVTAYAGGKKYDYEIKEGEDKVNSLVPAAGNTDGAPDPASVAWVDVFTKEGSALIRFGSFTGLSETDVANDYFGNFDERQGYVRTPTRADDGSGRNFTPSPGAYSFMRVEAGDGSETGVNRRFNFNVLSDPDLVNVFDAAGYYACKKVVLHENLYGEGELGTEGSEFDKAIQKGLFLTRTNDSWGAVDSNVLGKTTVYGNGRQISLQAKNKQLIDGAPDKKNNSSGVSFGNLYNVFVKGANPEETINVLRQKVVLMFTSAYYCDLQGYTKGRPQNSIAYIKNTVLHSASQSGFQLFYTGEKAYFENVTVVDCAAGITNEQRASEVGADHETNFYFKGNIDVLNYTNVRGVTNMAAGAVSDQSLGMLSGALTSVNDHFEWFGFNCTSDQFNTYNMPYFNLVIYTSNRKGVFNFWNGTSYVKSEDDISYKCSNCGAISPNNAFCEVCFRGKMEPAFNYSYGAPEGGSPMKTVLDLSDYKSYLDGAEVTAWTYNYPKVGNKPVIHNGQEATYKVTVDGRLPNMSGTSFQYYRYMFTEERYIRLLCQYVNATDGGATLVKNEEHILWHMQQAYRDKSLLTGRNHDHMAALRESLTGKNITWPDNTTPEQAMREYDEYQARLAAQ